MAERMEEVAPVLAEAEGFEHQAAEPMEAAEWFDFEFEEGDDEEGDESSASEDDEDDSSASEDDEDDSSASEDDEDDSAAEEDDEDDSSEEDEDEVDSSEEDGDDSAAEKKHAALWALIEAAAALDEEYAVEQAGVAAAPPVDIWSLLAAQEHFGSRPPSSLLRLRAVEVGHASTLEALLRLKVFDLELIPGLPRLSWLAKVELLLTLGAEAHVPIIISRLPIVGEIPIVNNYISVYGNENAITCHYLNAFRDWSWMLHTAAVGVGAARVFGQQFLPVLKRIAKASRRVVAGALTGRSEAWLRPRLDDVQLEMRTVKEGLVTFDEEG